MMVYSGTRHLGRAGIVLALLTLAGCDTFGNPLQAIRGSIPPPDEFQVIARKPIEMPASNALPEPTPGAPSPLDPNPHRDAITALMGDSASGLQTGAGASEGENVLLSSANAAAASSEIRVQLEEDKINSKKGKPYKAPSLAEVLGLTGGKPKPDEKELIDPVVESQRLQAGGIAAPADPEAKPDPKKVSEPPPPYPVFRPKYSLRSTYDPGY